MCSAFSHRHPNPLLSGTQQSPSVPSSCVAGGGKPPSEPLSPAMRGSTICECWAWRSSGTSRAWSRSRGAKATKAWKRTLKRQQQEETRSRWTRRWVARTDQDQKWTAATKEAAAETVDETSQWRDAEPRCCCRRISHRQHVRVFEFLSLFSNQVFSYLMKLCFTFNHKLPPTCFWNCSGCAPQERSASPSFSAQDKQKSGGD